MPVLDANESWMARRRTRTNEKQSAKLVFFTQITMQAAEDVEFLSAMNAAPRQGRSREFVTTAGLKDVYKDFNLAGGKCLKIALFFASKFYATTHAASRRA